MILLSERIIVLFPVFCVHCSIFCSLSYSQGTFNPESGHANATACGPCTQGFSCNMSGLVEPSGRCLAGFFCRGGAVLPNPVRSSRAWRQLALLCILVPFSVYSFFLFFILSLSATFSSSLCRLLHFVLLPGLSTLRFFAFVIQALASLPIFLSCSISPSTSTRLTKERLRCLASSGVVVAVVVAVVQVNQTYGDVCPPGHYCPVGTATPALCPVGTFSNVSGLMSALQCQNCSAGHACTA